MNLLCTRTECVLGAIRMNWRRYMYCTGIHEFLVMFHELPIYKFYSKYTIYTKNEALFHWLPKWVEKLFHTRYRTWLFVHDTDALWENIRKTRYDFQYTRVVWKMGGFTTGGVLWDLAVNNGSNPLFLRPFYKHSHYTVCLRRGFTYTANNFMTWQVCTVVKNGASKVMIKRSNKEQWKVAH